MSSVPQDESRSTGQSAISGLGLAISLDLTPGGSKPADSPPPATEARLGRYPITGKLGAGGMGEVLEVRDPDLGRAVAAKVIRHAAGRSHLERFVLEAQITGQLEHPNIVPIYELGVDPEGQIYFTMKKVPGQDLASILARERESGSPARLVEHLQIFLKVCDAVAFAHSRGVIHRDLKPSNIMVGSFGEVQVMDWGLAKVKGAPDPAARRVALEVGAGRIAELSQGGEEAPLRTQDGDIVGTPAYMPPEQAAGKLDEIDERSDIWSLGAILHEVLSGHPPFEGKNVYQILKQVLVARVPPSPAARAPERAIPWELDAVVKGAMSPKRDARYASVMALKADIQAYLEGRALSAAQYSAWQLVRKWMGRHRVVVAAACLVLTASLTAGAIAVVGINRQKEVALAERKVALDRAEDSRRQTERAEREKARAEENNRYARQAGRIQELTDLEREAADLYPAEPDRVAPMETWLDKARRLVADLAKDRAALAELRRKGRAPRDPSRLDDWDFGDSQAKWLHGVLSVLVDRGRKFTDLDRWKGTLASVEHRLAWAKTLRQRSIEAHRAAWDAAIASIRDSRACPAYRGLVISPQIGLVPIGRDPHSGLWEFGHLETGDLASRRMDGKLLLKPATGLVFVLLPGGTFRMGAERPTHDRLLGTPNVDPAAGDNDSPVHDHRLSAFFLSKYEMTQAQWNRAAGSNPSSIRPDTRLPNGEVITLLHPVEQVSWVQCSELLRRLGLALPTEAQWEYAARGGTASVFWTGNEVKSLQGAANVADRTAAQYATRSHNRELFATDLDDGYLAHSPVGIYRANAFGLHDTAGNVREWCQDTLGSYTLRPRPGDGFRPPGSEARGASEQRVTRGGAFFLPAMAARSAQRGEDFVTTQLLTIGVRPARALR